MNENVSFNPSDLISEVKDEKPKHVFVKGRFDLVKTERHEDYRIKHDYILYGESVDKTYSDGTEEKINTVFYPMYQGVRDRSKYSPNECFKNGNR